jgi:hypothetical protein
MRGHREVLPVGKRALLERKARRDEWQRPLEPRDATTAVSTDPIVSRGTAALVSVSQLAPDSPVIADMASEIEPLLVASSMT